jgi:hypothetical protein
MGSIKRQVRELIEQLPENVTWNEILNAIVLRRKIVESIAAADGGKVVSHKKVKERFLS